MTLRSFIRDEFGSDNLASDLAMYLQHNEGDLIGLMGTYVDDLCLAGNEEFEEITKLLEYRFDSKPRVYDDFYFSGVHIERNKDGTINVDQKPFIDRIEPLPRGASFELFRS